MILKLVFKKWDGRVLTVPMWFRIGNWLTLVNAGINLRFHKNAGNFLTSSMESVFYVLRYCPCRIAESSFRQGDLCTVRYCPIILTEYRAAC